MSKNEYISFRTQLNGYNKDDVNSFIEEQNIKYSNEELNYRKTIEEKQQQIKDLTAKLEEMGAGDENIAALSIEERENLESLLKQKDLEIEELKASVGSLKSGSESENYLVTIGEKDKEIEQLKAELAACKEKLEDKLSSSVEQVKQLAESDTNGTMYDQLSKQLGAMLIDARGIADNTVNDAKNEAEKILVQAKSEADKIMSEVGEKKDAEMDIIQRAIKRLSSDISCEYLKYISETRDLFEKLLADNSTKQTALLAELNDLYAKTQSVIDVEMKSINPQQ